MIAVSKIGPFLVRWPVLRSASSTARGSRMRASALAVRRVTALSPDIHHRGSIAGSQMSES